MLTKHLPECRIYRKHDDVLAVVSPPEGLVVKLPRGVASQHRLVLVGGTHDRWNFHMRTSTNIVCSVCAEDVSLNDDWYSTDKGWGLNTKEGKCSHAGETVAIGLDPSP